MDAAAVLALAHEYTEDMREYERLVQEGGPNATEHRHMVNMLSCCLSMSHETIVRAHCEVTGQEYVDPYEYLEVSIPLGCSNEEINTQLANLIDLGRRGWRSTGHTMREKDGKPYVHYVFTRTRKD